MLDRWCLARVGLGAALVCTGVPAGAYGQCASQQEAKLLASDGTAYDLFGFAVAISGRTALVGAYQHDAHSADSGAVYVIQNIGGVWTQTAEVSPSDAAPGDYFGGSVALSGDVAVIGAPGDDDHGSGSGSAYVFQNLGGAWTQIAKLTAPDGVAGDYFGVSVGVSGETAVIGAYGDDDHGTYTGSVYVFQRLNGTWTQTARLVASDAAIADFFGKSVSVSGDTIVVGAPRDDDRDVDSGSAYVFQQAGGVWTQMDKLIASDGSAYDYFGGSVAISGDTIVVGAENHRDVRGAAYIFERVGDTWTQSAALTAVNGAPNSHFGNSVAVSGCTAIVAEDEHYNQWSETGSMHIYQKLNGIWVEISEAFASDGATFDRFGCSVGVSGNTVIVGTKGDDDLGIYSGSAYVFVKPGEPCDVNCDGSVNAFDIQPLLEALSPSPPAPCAPCAGDANADGSVNQFDIQGVVECLGG